MRNFKNYDIWKLSHQLTLDIYSVTKDFPNSEKYQIISQMQRAAYSIPSNISEGCGRKSDKDFNRFLQIALGSAHELEYFVLLSKDLNFINEETYTILDEKINNLKKRIYSLSQKL
ncbi:four helix bundle protein [Psychroflexus sp. CAK1W]|uniref:four helix bundle protein n=1 Tax=Psychroflexus curvus TaxID=2873595 RepID=UPI001CCC069D|nr:four helix bundle protein [Psychroflexus curvus]MBZ9629084.1 four helix bundle protein [Psychroflexus curvus]